MGRIVQNCINQLREMSVANLEETMESLAKQGFGDSAAPLVATAGAGAGAGATSGSKASAAAAADDMDTVGDDKAPTSTTLLGAIVAKLLSLIK